MEQRRFHMHIYLRMGMYRSTSTYYYYANAGMYMHDVLVVNLLSASNSTN